MLIDDGANAFRKADTAVTVDRTDKLAHFNVTEKVEGTDNLLMHGEGLRHDRALALRDQIGGRNGAQALLQEMISVRLLTVALINCGSPVPAAKPLAENLLRGIIDLLADDAHVPEKG